MGRQVFLKQMVVFTSVAVDHAKSQMDGSGVVTSNVNAKANVKANANANAIG